MRFMIFFVKPSASDDLTSNRFDPRAVSSYLLGFLMQSTDKSRSKYCIKTSLIIAGFANNSAA
mgnify:CR=1 FL=1